MTMISINPQGDIAPAPGVSVLKAHEYDAFVEAAGLIGEARERAAGILAEAGKDAEERRRAGFEAGVREGKDEVAEQFFAAVSGSVEQLAGMENALVDVVIRSLRTILGSFDREELAVQTVSHALRLVRDEKRVLLRVSPDDAPLVEKRLAEITKPYPVLIRVDVRADASLSPGGCVMETELGVIDATLDRQLAVIEDAFRQQLDGRPGR